MEIQRVQSPFNPANNPPSKILKGIYAIKENSNDVDSRTRTVTSVSTRTPLPKDYNRNNTSPQSGKKLNGFVAIKTIKIKGNDKSGSKSTTDMENVNAQLVTPNKIGIFAARNDGEKSSGLTAEKLKGMFALKKNKTGYKEGSQPGSPVKKEGIGLFGLASLARRMKKIEVLTR